MLSKSSNIAVWLAMMLIIPMALTAQFSGGSGSLADPYLVATPADVNNLRYYPGLYYRQISDINMNVAPYNQGYGWHPIGDTSGALTYYYDGGGHKLVDLTIIEPTSPFNDPKGLFCRLTGGYLRDLTLENFEFGSQNAGALAYSSSGVQIENCHVSGTFYSEWYERQWVGGLIAQASNFTSFFNCSASISAELDYPGIGGLVGYLTDCTMDSCWAYVDINRCGGMGGLASRVHNSTITRCWATGRLTGFSGFSGGLFSVISASNVSRCYVNMEIAPSSDLVGGLAGKSHSGCVFSNCHADVWFSGALEGYASGLIGDVYGTQIINCYSRCVQNDAGCMSALGILADDCTVTNSYYNSELMTPELPFNYDASAARTTAQMTWPYDSNTYVGWDFDNVWLSDSNSTICSGYPRLRDIDYSSFVNAPRFNWRSGFYCHTLVFEISCAGPEADIHYTLDGSKPDIDSPLYTEPFLINTSTTIKARAFNTGYYPSSISIVDIVTSPYDLLGTGTQVNPFQISSVYQLYEINAHLDSHFILTADIDIPDQIYPHYPNFIPIGKYSGPNSPENRPFTGSLNGNDYTIYNGQISGTESATCGLFAYCMGAEFMDVMVRGDSATGISHTGMLAGLMEDCVVTRCQAWGEVESENSYAGLLVGKAENSNFNQCFSRGWVAGGSCNGGLIGSQTNGIVTDCYSLTNVAEAAIAGGLLGSLNGSGEVQRCYSAGVVSGQGTGIGGLLGSGNQDMVIFSFWDMQASGQTQSAGGTSCTTSQMQNVATYETWNFQNVWQHPLPGLNLGYPTLVFNDASVDADEQVPAASMLSVWPNPFFSDLKLRLDLPRAEKTELSVYNLRGQRIRSLFTGTLSAGSHELIWDARDDHRNPMASGVYFIRIESDSVRQVHKVLLLK